MEIAIIRQGRAFSAGDTVIAFATEEDARNLSKALPESIAGSVNAIDTSHFKGKPGELLPAFLSKGPRVIISGIGAAASIREQVLRNAAAAVIPYCRERDTASIIVIVPEIANIAASSIVRSISEGLLLANYSFDRYKSKSAEDIKPLVKKAMLMAGTGMDSSIIKETVTVCSNTLLCRDLVNENSDRSDAVRIAAAAKSLSRIRGVKCSILARKDIERHGMGLLLAVNRGSAIPPRLVVLSYRGDSRSGRSFAIVGKGITFDSGGINLKPSGHIETMRSDMAGAAAVLYAFKSIAELGLKKNVHAVIPLTDNMIGADSYRPGDIFRAHNGTTVEIGNTDAEGRLILADALSYAVSVLKPEAIVDVATLTGACVVTFGELVAAYLTNDDELGGLLENAARTTGETVWKLPMLREYEDNIKSDFADIANISAERNAGTIIGAVFLKNFVGSTRWAHIDIAGTSWYTKPRGVSPKYATGFGVRLLFEIIKNWR